MEGHLTMSRKGRNRALVFAGVRDGRVSLMEAAEQLGLCYRQVKAGVPLCLYSDRKTVFFTDRTPRWRSNRRGRSPSPLLERPVERLESR